MPILYLLYIWRVTVTAGNVVVQDQDGHIMIETQQLKISQCAFGAESPTFGTAGN